MNESRKLPSTAGAPVMDNTNVVPAGEPDGMMLQNPRLFEKPAHVLPKGLLCLALALSMAGSVSAQTASKGGLFDWVHGFFLDVGVLGNYENVDPPKKNANPLGQNVEPPDDPRIESGFLLFEIGGGYDFGRITSRLYVNFGLPIDGVVYYSNAVARLYLS